MEVTMKRVWTGLALAGTLVLLLAVTVGAQQSDLLAGLVQPLIVDVEQAIPVDVQLAVPLEDGETMTVTTPITVTVALQIQIDGAHIVTVQPLPAEDAAITVGAVEEAAIEEAAAGALSFSGVGQAATDLFTLEAGLTVFTMTHDGTGHFAVILMDSEGNTVDLLANKVGAFDGSKATKTKDGDYILDVAADGNWTIEIE